MPQNLVSAGVVWKYLGWRADLGGRFIDKQYLDQAFAGLPSVTIIGAYTVVNLGISDTPQLADSGFGRTLKVGLNADNLFDRRYLNTAFTDIDYFGNAFIRGVIAPPRMITGSVDVTF